MSKYLKVPLIEPKVGDAVINDCDSPYIFCIDDDDMDGDEWPVVKRDGKSLIEEHEDTGFGLFSFSCGRDNTILTRIDASYLTMDLSEKTVVTNECVSVELYTRDRDDFMFFHGFFSSGETIPCKLAGRDMQMMITDINQTVSHGLISFVTEASISARVF